ncbi:DENN domain-containing protein 1A isoform X3 [Sitodiplosis mosellana]|uniref:DENN domain-containing protein 1A isoform X3 n=1 Tax=Sitodiplosis mosellana TaxID=263140 RepID=UPI002444714B|nr:DENN domain-containing protein 1A isoform X3 [Sitodiplosis mosellana]
MTQTQTTYRENVQKLFEYWCEISPTAIGEKVSGVIVESFPERFKDTEIITKIPEFAYPCQFLNESVQTYSFVLTSSDSKWRFGFCRHDAKAQTAMVIITYLPWHDTFLKFLNVLGELKRTSKNDFQPFLAEAYAKGVPEPGACLRLFYNSGLSSFDFQRPSQFQLPSIPENHNLNLYYNFVDPKNMIAVFAAMLAERRLVFTSQRLDRLSSSVQAAHAFLYPMVWQHIFIPILPLKMKEILCAPMPYLIGVPEAVLETMTREELGEVVILNCDNKYFESPFDDVKNMPAELVSQLKKQLSNQHDHIGDRVSKIFLGVLVQLIGGYRDAIKFSQGAKLTWCRETFIDSRPSHLRPFLRDMLELQIFQQFIEERLEMLNTGLGFSDEFELETLRHHEKPRQRIKPFLRNVKDKVKQGGRGMKTAYKGLKSKLSDRTPSKESSSRSGSVASAPLASGCRSEPNSPVFTKRPQSDLISISNSSTHRSKPPKMLQTSNSMINNSNLTNHFNNNITINNNSSSSIVAAMASASTASAAAATTQNGNSIISKPNHGNAISHSISKSPITVSSSPTSSLSSTSEMNILQELQQHALFKMPTVDRSLKPVNSTENRRSSRSGSLVNTPDHQAKSSTIPPGTLFPLDDVGESSPYLEARNDSSASNSTCSFDAPPDVLPPVPPRITNPPPRNNRNATSEHLIIIDTDDQVDPAPVPAARNRTKTATQPPPPPLPPHNSVAKAPANNRNGFENNFVQNTNSLNLRINNIIINRTESLIEPSPKPPPLPPQNYKLNMTNETKTSEVNSDVPADLIELNSREESFEVDDFDPLNQNAKQIPTVPKRSPVVLPPVLSSVPKGASPNSSNAAFSNPMYPYFVPSYLQKKANTAPVTNAVNNTKIDDDVELLRKYGLDQFKLIERNSRTSTSSNDTAPHPFRMGSGNQHTNRTSETFRDNGLQTNGDIHRPKSNNNWTTFD